MSAPPVRQRPTVSDNARRRRPRREGRLDVRIGTSGLAAIDQRAAEDGRDRSDWSRLALAYAVANMPRGWHPSPPRAPRP